MCVKLCPKLLLLLTLIIYLNHSNAYRVKFTNLICKSFNQSWVVFKECRLRAVSRNKTTLTILVDVLKPAYDIFVRTQMLKKANGYKPWLIDYTVDGCKFIRQRNHPFVNIIWKLIKDDSTINHTCPYVGPQALRNFYKIDNIPIILPNGEYLLNITWIFDRKPQFVTSVFYTFWEDA